MAKGRPRKIAPRTPSGQLSRAGMPKYDRGNDRVIARKEAFSVFQGGKADQQVHDPIGRAWAAGLLDGTAFDPAVLRDAGRDYAQLYWMYWPAVTGVGGYEPRGRTGPAPITSADDPRGERFKRLDGLAMSAGRKSYDAMQALCVQTYWFPDDDPEWLARLLRAAMAKAHVPIEADMRMLANAIDALVVMTEGRSLTQSAA